MHVLSFIYYLMLVGYELQETKCLWGLPFSISSIRLERKEVNELCAWQQRWLSFQGWKAIVGKILYTQLCAGIGHGSQAIIGDFWFNCWDSCFSWRSSSLICISRSLESSKATGAQPESRMHSLSAVSVPRDVWYMLATCCPHVRKNPRCALFSLPWYPWGRMQQLGRSCGSLPLYTLTGCWGGYRLSCVKCSLHNLDVGVRFFTLTAANLCTVSFLLQPVEYDHTDPVELCKIA